MKFHLSIIIISYNRAHLLNKCLQSIDDAQTQAQTQIHINIILLFNGDHKTFSQYKKITAFLIPTTILYCPKTTNGNARNIALEKAQGNWVCFFDDDIEIPLNYFEQAISLIQANPTVDIFGGPDLTNLNPSTFQRAIGLIQESKMAMGPTHKRHSSLGMEITKASEIDLILCNLWIKKSLLGKERTQHLFNTYIRRNEENLLLDSIANAVILYNPQLFVWHYRKSNILKLLLAIGSSGYHRAWIFFINQASFKWEFTIPSLFFLYLFLLLIMPYQSYVRFIPLLIYLFCCFVEAFRHLIYTQRPFYFMTTFFLIPLIHLTYGLSFLIGLILGIKRKILWQN